ncbi:Mediator of RNA polymerase II transcription subunit 4 [Toxocara canis]|uniref:Mediator of RNA polymerase II transcription subunit 4 n=1 Tax=Toxocara canis TaxID=6265 RepID=A0A0B2VNP8_TOXCA|nr:Mediator of RNA polymerase II transcription subunit 4 [Toxocara canis]
MTDGRSLRECLLESVDDLDAVVKQMVAFLLERDRTCESMESLSEAFRRKQEQLKQLLSKVHDHRAREQTIRNLEKAVEERDAVIENIQNKLQVAETALTGAVYQAGIKIKAIRQAETKKVNSEQVIRFANQISKSYSVAAPLFWRLGDASRPFPTEMELRVSSLAAPRVTAPTATPALSLLRQPTASATGMLRGTGRGASPMASSFSAAAMQQQQRSWSPRGGFIGQSSSPRGRGSRGGLISPRMNAGASALLQRRQSGTSPRISSPSSVYSMGGKGMPPPLEGAILKPKMAHWNRHGLLLFGK